ncbi:MAG: hypothetical protein JW807_00690, partial [Spirochaetes bacterium]|nr:hypothetical protein [Spirochaetota bacterium]
MNKYIQYIILCATAGAILSCGGTDLLDQSQTLETLTFPSGGSAAPEGNDVLSATTNRSDKEEEKAPKLDPLAGAGFIKPPQINNYGTVSLNYPMETPPGRHGIQPSVGLSYSSSGGDGLAGIGWSLSTGLGVISRTTKNGQLYYDYRDTFTFNGQRLVKAEGQLDTEDGVYRLEIESGFSKFILSNSASGGVWRVVDKAGTVTVFGEDLSSRIYVPDDNSKTYIWNFCRSTDLNGNYMTAEYDDSSYEADHILYLKEIRYTGNDAGLSPRQYIRFHYIDREEAYVSKAPGFVMRMDRLLDSVEAGWDDPLGVFGTDTELWRYSMVYATSEDSGRPLLQTIDSTRNTTSPEFIYQPAEHYFVWRMVSNPDSGDLEANPEATQYFEGDFNGDGLSDMVFFNPENGLWKAAEAKVGGGYTFKTYANRFQGYDGPSKIQWFKGNVTGDYDGDGRSDIAFYLTESKEFWVARHNGQVFEFLNFGRLYAPGLDIFACEWFPGDYDGNGLSDAVLFDEANGAWYLMRNMGGSFEFIKFSQHFRNIFRNDYSPDSNMDSPYTADTSPYGADRGRVHFLSGDYNGDGRTDISIYDERDGKWWVAENYRAEGLGFTLQWKVYKVFTAPEQALFGHDRFSGDFNGDGYSDFLLFDKESAEWIIGETLDGTIRFRIFSRVPQFKGITRWLQGDFNGDGRTDIGFFCAEDGNFWIGEATSTGFRYRIYNNLSYGPSRDRVLRTPMPRDEVTIAEDSAVVSSASSTAQIDYRFNGNYNPDRGERVFPGHFMTDSGTGNAVPAILIFDRKGDDILYKDSGSGAIAAVWNDLDLEAEGTKILNQGRPMSIGGRDAIAYYRQESGSHVFRVLRNRSGAWENDPAAKFGSGAIPDFDIGLSVYFIGNFDSDDSSAEALVLNDRREAGPQWELVSGTTVTSLTISGLSADVFKAVRNYRQAFRFFSGRFTATAGSPDQVLMVDMRAADHKWYIGTIGSGTITFEAVTEPTATVFPVSWQDGRSRVMEDGSLLLWRDTSTGLQFMRVVVTDSGGAFSLTLVNYTPVSSDYSFKGEFAYVAGEENKSPVIRGADGLRKAVFNGTRCDLSAFETGSITASTIDRTDLTDSDDFYVFRWIQGDYNGDGKTDIGIFHLKEPTWYFAQTVGTVPDMISRVNNGIGGTYDFEYANSTAFDNTGEDGVPHLPMNYKVCTRLTVNDGLGREIVTAYEYAKGYAFSAFINGYKETDYFGFGEFTVIDSLGSKNISLYNNVPYDDFRKNRALAGAVKQSRFLGWDGREYSRTENEYTVRVIEPSPPAPLPGGEGRTTRSYLIEPTEVRTYRNDTLAETRTSNITLTPGEYEMTAKAESVTDHYSDGAHEPVTNTAYTHFTNIDSTNEMRVDYKKNLDGTSYETTTSYEYDDRGNVTRETASYTGTGLPAVSNKIMEYEYDAYGNRVRETNASGSPARVTEKEYDGRLHQFVVKDRVLGATVPLDTTYEINYASAFGGINRKTDPNGNSTYFEYDTCGRLDIERIDIDSEIKVLQNYDYSTAFPLSGKVTQYDGSGGEIATRTFADGMGRAIHSVRSATNETGKKYVKTGRLVYDALGRVIRKSQTAWAADDEIDAYRANTTEKNPTLTQYDASGRVKKVTLPAGFAGEAETSVTYTYNDPWEIIETHSVGRSKRTVKNARGLVLYVEDSGRGDPSTSLGAGEFVSAKIGFAYDIAGNLVKKMDLPSPPSPLPGGEGGGMSLDIPAGLFAVGAKDTSGSNVAAWRYNAFGQVTESSDPDLGYAYVSYNAFGEAAARMDAMGRVTSYTYDNLGRLTRKDLPGTEGAVVMTYDALEFEPNPLGAERAENALGRLVAIEDPAERKEFNYDKIGRVNGERRRITGDTTGWYWMLFNYDLLDRKTTIYYPPEEKTGVLLGAGYAYNAMGVTQVGVNNGNKTKMIVTEVKYNEFGQMTEVHRGNNSITYYTYDIKGRLEKLLTTAQHNGQTWKVQDVTYEFKVDNSIAAIENNPDVAADGACLSTIRYEYTYDGLNRLARARGSYEKTSLVPEQPGDPGEPPIPGGTSFVKKYELGYGYSANGNLTGKTIYDADTGSVTDDWAYGYANHAATSITTAVDGARFVMQYDDAGNMIQQWDNKAGKAKQMAYDSYNRIRTVTDPSNGNIKGQYWYDDQGLRVRRVAKQEVDGEEREVEVLYPSMYYGVE